MGTNYLLYYLQEKKKQRKKRKKIQNKHPYIVRKYVNMLDKKTSINAQA